MGGEITWKCQGNSYIFELKFYRDCNGINGPSSVTLETNQPTFSGAGIQMNLVLQSDISPTGSATSGNSLCKTCAQATGNTPGAVEEFVYRSAPVVLAGIPPATGWAFWYDDCCRSTLLTNVSNGLGNIGYTTRAKMYPWSASVAGQCKDASPYFAEKPSTITCAGYPFTYNHNAVDPELDSLVYSFDNALDYGGYPQATVPYVGGYSGTNPMPSTGANVPATINAANGEIKYTCSQAGYFVMVVKVAAYKCNTVVAEVWREINIVLVAGCGVNGSPGVVNNPPVITKPFPDPVTGVPNMSFKTSVYANDTVAFVLPAVDLDLDPAIGAQYITFNASGIEFGTAFTNANAGCIIPPCATLAPAPAIPPAAPIQYIFGTQTAFNWKTTCNHLKGLDTLCTRISNKYTFVIRVNDNFCPANGISVATVEVEIKRPPKLLPPKVKCASVLNKFGDVELSWAPPTPRDTHATFDQYEIWASLNPGGPYFIVDSVYGGLNKYLQTSEIVTGAQLFTALNANAQTNSIYFQMFTRCGCDSDSISVASNTVRTMKVNATQVAGGANVTWNPVHNPLLATSSNKYDVYREYPVGSNVWTMIATVNHPTVTYLDPFILTMCDDSVTYRIQTKDDSLLCTSWSSFKVLHVTNAAPVASITPAAPAFCTGSNVQITANAGGTTYLWSTGTTTQSLNVSTAGTYTVTITYQPGGCTSTATKTVVQNTPPTASVTGTSAICAGSNTNVSFAFTGTGPWTYSYTANATASGNLVANVSPVVIAVNPAATTTYTVTSVSNAACPGSITGAAATVTVNPKPTAAITGTASICAGLATNLTINFANAPGPYTYSYKDVTNNITYGPFVSAAAVVNIPVNPAATTTYQMVSVSNANCTGTITGANAIVTVNVRPTASVTGTAAICAGSNTNISIAFTGVAPYTYSYTANGVSSGILNSNTSPAVINVAPGVTTNYVVTAVSNALCTGSVTGTPAVVTVNARPSATIVGNPVICRGQQTNLTVNFAGAAGPYTFTYNPGNVVVNNAANPSVINVAPTATTNYTLVSVSNANCSGAVNGASTVTVNQLPTAQISGTQAICAGQPANLSISFTGTGPWNYSYLANGNPVGPFNTNVSPTVIAVNPAILTNYTLPLAVSDANCAGTVTSGTATVTVNALPTAQLSGSTTVCAGTAANLNINFTGAAPFVYSYSNGTNVFGPFNTNLNNVNIPVNPASTTVYTMTPTLTGAGCTGNTAGAATITVNTIPNAAITVSGNDTICNGSGTNLTVNFANGPAPYTYSYTANGTLFGPFNSNSAAVVIPVAPVLNTTYAVTNISNGNCPGTVAGSTAIVHVTPLPTAQITGTTAICDGQATNLHVAFTGEAPYTYSYKDGPNTYGPFVTNSSSVNINVNPTSTTNYVLTPVVTGNNCQGATSGAALITVNALPSAAIAGAPVICAGDQTNLSISFTGVAPFTYRYSDGISSFGPFTTSDNPTAILVSPSTSRTYTLTSIVDANCAGTLSGASLVTVNPLPTAHIAGTATICNGQQTNLDITFTGTAPFTYSYSDGTNTFGPFNTNNANVAIPVHPSASTTYSVTAVDDNNCTGTFSGSAVVTVNQLPTAVLSGTPVICNGQNTALQINFTGTAPFVYSYSDGTTVFGPFQTSSNPANINVSPVVSTNYTLTPTVTGAGCTGNTSGNASVVVHQLPTAVASGTPVICNGDQTTFNITFTGAPPFNYAYTDGVSTYGPFVTSNTNEVINVSPTTTTSYTVYSISDVNCSGTKSGQADVTVNQLPTAAMVGTAFICDGSATNLRINFTGSAPYTYSYSDGTNTFGPFQTSNNPELISVQPSSTTSYSVTAVQDLNCTGSVSGNATVTVYDLPSAIISDDTNICIGASANFKITFVGTAPYNYKYSDGTSVFGPFSTSDNPKVVNVTPSSTKTYTLIDLNDAHCPGSFSGTANVTVHPLPTPQITGTTVICDGTSSVFNAGGGYTGYVWSTGESTQTISITDEGNYSVIVTDINQCVNSTSQHLTVNETPVVSFTNDSSLTCEIPKINFFNGSSYPAGSIFHWEFGDGGLSDQENPSHEFNLPGVYPITLVITSLDGCADSLTQPTPIDFYPLPVADFKLNPSIASVFNSTVNFVDESQNAITWNWYFGDGNKTTEREPVHYYDEIGKYTVKLVVTNIAGCVSEFTDVVLITPFFIPNAFTPNDDGLNDKFFSAGYIMDVSSYSMSVFNRWGEKVYANNDYRLPWNGVGKNGKPAPEGTYVYAIKVTTHSGKPYEYTGTVTLVR